MMLLSLSTETEMGARSWPLRIVGDSKTAIGFLMKRGSNEGGTISLDPFVRGTRTVFSCKVSSLVGVIFFGLGPGFFLCFLAVFFVSLVVDEGAFAVG